MADRRQLYITDATESADRGALRADGTMWSHGATPGKFFRNGESFTIGEAELKSFVKNFNSGYPSKVPVDYEHGSTNGATSMGHAIPKAGDVVEMHAVLTAADITPDIQAAVDRTETEWKALGINKKVNPLGLWYRWRPTDKAHQLLKSREYTEASIAFADDVASNTTGESQGPTILAIALTNRPFLDGMASIAATAATPQRHEAKTMFESLIAALTGKPVKDDAEAQTALTAEVESKKAVATQLAAVTEFRDIVAGELGGEKDAAKVQAKIRQLVTDNAKLANDVTAASDGKIAAQVELAMHGYEKKLTPASKAMYVREMTANLKAGEKSGETATDKVLKSLPDLDITTQSTVTDNGKGLDADGQIAIRATELSEKDPRISKIKDPNARLLAAATQAKAELAAANPKK